LIIQRLALTCVGFRVAPMVSEALQTVQN
jgi:hypothetical protein